MKIEETKHSNLADEIKPCPFCGMKQWLNVSLEQIEHIGRCRVVTTCKLCNVAMVSDSASISEAVEKWNNRY